MVILMLFLKLTTISTSKILFIKKEKQRKNSIFYMITKMKKTNPSTVLMTSETPSALAVTVIMTFPKPSIGEFSIVAVVFTSRDDIVPD